MLEVSMQTTIQTLIKKGYSKARISRELGVSPKTIRKVLKSQEEGDGEIQKKPHPSMLDQYQEFIEIQRSKGLSKQRIFQDLQVKGFTGGYSSVRDYIAKQEQKAPKAYMVMNALPGEEAQVDFGRSAVRRRGIRCVVIGVKSRQYSSTPVLWILLRLYSNSNLR